MCDSNCFRVKFCPIESGGFCEVLETHDRWVPGFGDLIEAGLNEGAAGFARRGLWGLYFCALAAAVAWRGGERRLIVFVARRLAPTTSKKAGGGALGGLDRSTSVQLHRRRR
jgi:hypothetical protein